MVVTSVVTYTFSIGSFVVSPWSRYGPSVDWGGTLADKRNELKKLNGQHTDPEIEGDSEDTYKLIDEVVNMVEYLEKVPRKKFRNVSEKDLEIIMGKINVVLSNKQSNLHLLFNGPKSFVEN